MALGYLRNSGKAIVPIPLKEKLKLAYAYVRILTYFCFFQHVFSNFTNF